METRVPGVLCPVPCGSPITTISGACSLASHLHVARRYPHPTGRQDAAGVPGGEAQHDAGREHLLAVLVSPAWAETARSLRASA